MRIKDAFRSPWGLLVVAIGLAVVVAGTFMPLADTSGIGGASRNTFAERQYVLWVYLAVAITFAVAIRFQFFPTRDSAIGVIAFCGITFLSLVLFVGLIDVYAVPSPVPVAPREHVSMEVVDNWGMGMFVSVVGSLVALAGGCLDFRNRDHDLTEREIREKEEKENAPLPEAKAVLPGILWRLVFGAAVILALVPLVIAIASLPPSNQGFRYSVGYFAWMAVIWIYFGAVFGTVRKWMKEVIVPTGAPNAPPRRKSRARSSST